ncbi:methionyl-tRNA formyltransferase [Candidatus Erwinia haradaeae]|uniref:Methionyl-tRNA formyltransferase n=1 Tax=Candidatus Erwinia haradaeae TaxID=1922217 RepID=A0A451DK68_9GAMM|nr:methionyl-tRNA formyltransferase [Candidatus Erwinia haradaeae]VFP87122.1 Methionyl-tRNA formyltransferase [Candidatus Erwinia haradaeae]
MSHSLKIIFAGTSEFAKYHLHALLLSHCKVVLVLTRPDRPSGRGQKNNVSPVKKLAEESRIPIFQPESLDSQAEKDIISAFNADIIVVVAYGLIFPQAILEIPRLGCINVHASLLPKWRGAAPIQRALCAGDSETGVSIIKMDSRLDTGDILHRVSCPIHFSDTTATLYNKLANLGSLGLLTTLTELENNTYNFRIQGETQASYAYKLTKAEARLNWSLSAVQLERCIRAFNPWPVSYFMIGNQCIKVWKASVLPSVSDRRPGEIIKAEKEGIQVVTADGILNIQELQLAGKNKITVQALLNSYHPWCTIGKLIS